jgi:hypothetical protein
MISPFASYPFLESLIERNDLYYTYNAYEPEIEYYNLSAPEPSPPHSPMTSIKPPAIGPSLSQDPEPIKNPEKKSLFSCLSFLFCCCLRPSHHSENIHKEAPHAKLNQTEAQEFQNDVVIEMGPPRLYTPSLQSSRADDVRSLAFNSLEKLPPEPVFRRLTPSPQALLDPIPLEDKVRFWRQNFIHDRVLPDLETLKALLRYEYYDEVRKLKKLLELPEHAPTYKILLEDPYFKEIFSLVSTRDSSPLLETLRSISPSKSPVGFRPIQEGPHLSPIEIS